MAKKRLDLILLERGLSDTRKKAQALIMSGDVLVDDEPVDKSGAQISEEAEIRLRRQPSRFVSRGGEKLEGALLEFTPHLEGIIAIDVGSSTGGFSDCLLQRGVAHVYAVDVGRHQLHSKLRDDERVTVMEQCNARELHPELFPKTPTLAVMDVSFIGLQKILKPVLGVLSESAEVIALVKPQFELEPQHVEKGGVVRSLAAQERAVSLVKDCGEGLGLEFLASAPSVLRGEKKGNQEYFVYFRRGLRE